MAEKKLDWNPYRYGFNNPIRLIDPTGMSEEEVEFPPKDFKGNSWCDSDGCFNRTNESSSYEWRDNEGKPVSYYSSEAEIKSSKTWHSKLASATENFFGVTEADLHDPESDAVYKMMEKEVLIALNVLTLGESTFAFNSAKGLHKYIQGYGMVNDALSLNESLTGIDIVKTYSGEPFATFNTGVNAMNGIVYSVWIDKKISVGNVGDMYDLYKSFNENGK